MDPQQVLDPPGSFLISAREWVAVLYLAYPVWALFALGSPAVHDGPHNPALTVADFNHLLLVPMLLILSVATGIGVWQCKLWARNLALFLLVYNFLVITTRLVGGGEDSTAENVLAIQVATILYLFNREVRNRFSA